MECSSCQRENPADASFCSQCGAKLTAVCPDCARPCDPNAAFCSGCGRKLATGAVGPGHKHDARVVTPPHLAAKILRDRATLEGEHRTVTVLFIDAVASVASGERIDQEQLHRVTSGATERMVSAVHRFEGTVAQFRGDGIMALFGAPIAHEDTARRGIAAAIAMRDSLAAYDRELRLGGSAGFTYRIGLHTGPVIVGRIGDDLSMDYTAIGDTVNLAARMEQWAAPGKIYLTDQTQRLAAGYFEFTDLGALEVKGKSEAVRAFEVERELASRTRLDVAVERGLSRYVGRAHELSVLRSHFEQVKEGHGQVVFVSGEAGMGKSRLMLEFRRSLAVEDLTWLTGQCISYGRHIPYLPIIELLKRNFGVEETDDQTAIVARLDEQAENWDELTRRSLPYIKFLMNVDPGDERAATMDPVERRAGILDALRAMLVRDSSQRPVVMLIEDLHWIDEKSEEAIAALVEITAAARVLMILTYRPGYAPLLGDRTYYNQVSLRHLAVDESEGLLESVLGAGTCPEAIRRLITDKAEGNPFYVEEVAKSLVESGTVRVTDGAYALTRPIDQVRIPETIEEVILTRIDRLDRDAKGAIQLASVIGREFTVRLLGRMSETKNRLDDLLGELKALELIYEKAYSPELSYMFKHALTHDVAYSTLLGERRKALHRLVGAAVEELYADRLTEQYETVAHHYEQGEDWPKALEYLTKAGDKSVASFANRDAIDFYERALRVSERIGDSTLRRRYEVAAARASVQQLIGELGAATADFDRAREAAMALGDRSAEGMTLCNRAFAELFDHDFEAGAASLEEDLGIGREGFVDVRFTANVYLALSALLTGEASAARYLDEALALMDAASDATPKGMFSMWLGLLPYWTGRFDDGLAAFDSCRERVLQSGQMDMILEHAWLQALAHAHRGEYQRAIAELERLHEECERVGGALYFARGFNTLGWVYGELQNHDLALEWNLRSIDAAMALGAPDPEVEMNARLNAADNLVALGRAGESEPHFKIVERVVYEPAPPERWMLWRYSQHYFHSFGELCLARGDTDRALSLADECISLARDTETRKNIVKGRRLRGQALLAGGKFEDAEREILAALDLAREIGNPGQLWKTHEALGDLRRTEGRADDARSAYGDALAVVQRVAASLTNHELRDTLLKSAAVRRLQDRIGTS